MRIPPARSAALAPPTPGVRSRCGLGLAPVVLAVALPVLPSLAHAQTSADTSSADGPRVLRALRIGEGIRLDGELSEAVWSRAEVATGFTQAAPDPGAPSSQRTEARVLYTEDALYVGMRLFDTSPQSIAAQLARRDAAEGYSDWAHVIIDSYHDGRTGFGFAVNPAGVLKDTLYFDDGDGEDPGWDAVWKAAARVDPDGWSVEFRIPFSQLRFSVSSTQWGIQFVREIARAGELAHWAPVPPDALRFVSLFGTLAGLSGLRSARRLEIVPYASTSLTREPGLDANPFHSPSDADLKMGGDVKYGLGSNLTLSGTVNPDFGQVEADRPPAPRQCPGERAVQRGARCHPYPRGGQDLRAHGRGMVDRPAGCRDGASAGAILDLGGRASGRLDGAAHELCGLQVEQGHRDAQ